MTDPTAPPDRPRVVLAEAMTRFRCNEKGCCCKGWTIPFEADEVLALQRALPEDEGKALLDGATVWLQEDGETVESLRLAPVGPEDACRWLATDGRCGVQVRLGAAVLPHLCRAFPGFAFRRDDGVVEVHFDAVCPEVLEQLDEDDGPLAVVEAAPPPDDHVAIRARFPSRPGGMAIGGRAISLEELVPVRAAILAALADPAIPALDRLSDISHALARLGRGEPVAAFAVRDERGGGAADEAFEAFFEDCVAAHDAGALARYLASYRRFVHAFDVPAAGARELARHLPYDPRWRERLDPRAPELQPLLRRFLANRYLGAWARSRGTGQLAFVYGTVTHALGTAFRYAPAVAAWAGRPADRTTLKVALGAAEYFLRTVEIAPAYMPWFGLSPPDPGGPAL